MKEKNMASGLFWTLFKNVVVTFAVTAAIVSCTTNGNRGTLQRDRDLDNQFMRYEVVPDHRYYYSGGYGKPNAILGIHKDYQLVSDLWQSIEISSVQLEKWIRTIDPEDYRGTAGYFAAYILNPEGKRVGIWYSIQSTTRINFLEGNKIEVFTPNLHQPEPGQGRMRRGF